MSLEESLSLDEIERPDMTNLTEEDFFRLSPEDQEEALNEVSQSLIARRGETLEALAEADADIESGHFARAEETLTNELDRFGEMTADPDALLLTRVVGMMSQQQVVTWMETLYSRSGDHGAAERTRRHRQDIRDEKDEVRRQNDEAEQ